MILTYYTGREQRSIRVYVHREEKETRGEESLSYVHVVTRKQDMIGT